MKRNKENGFTLVELLAVIVILAIVLVIAVPKVMSIIEDSKKATLESTAKMIASAAEKAKVQNTVLGNNKEITCDSVAKINKGDYSSCSIEFEDNTAKVTIEGKGKFENLWVCKGTKTSADAQKSVCIEPIEVNHPLFLAGQELTPDKFEVTLNDSDGNSRKLWSGGLKPDDSQMITITSPNWPENYPTNMTEEENYWEYTLEGADEIQIIFDETSRTHYVGYDYIVLYNEEGNEVYRLGGDDFGGKVYTITGDYIKITMVSDSNTYTNYEKGFSANIKPLYNKESEYTVSPSVVPNIDGNFDITITIKDDGTTKKINSKTIHKLNDYISEQNKSFLKNSLEQTNVEYEGTTYGAGIRYITKKDIYGEEISLDNKVYYNCDDTDTNGVSYGTSNYDYESSCEVWRIIGVFDTKSNTGGTAEKRVKIINTESMFGASWDSSYGGYNSETYEYYGINAGSGINQWGESTYEDGTTYEGADLMRLLNGYYIGKQGASCIYCNDDNQEECSQTCTNESLTSAKMKPLTSKAKSMIENAVWTTYGVSSSDANDMYLEEIGMSAQNTGRICNNAYYCTDKVIRTTSWTGLVGLMSASDIEYANGWLDSPSGKYYYPWTITPVASGYESFMVYYAGQGYAARGDGSGDNNIYPTVYLKSGIKVIGGNGDTEPYILGL